MLVYCNGAFKSGSTWLYHIAKKLRPGNKVPEQFQNPNQNASGIPHDKLGQFLKEVDYSKVDYIVKAHLASLSGRHLIEGTPNVKILTTERDIRDVAVSSYYHYLRLGKISGTFEEYFWEGGERTIRRVLRYHKVWNPPSPSICKTTYEGLLENFDAEVRKLAEFLEVKLSEDDLARVKEQTSLSTAQKRERNRKGEDEQIYFFRKGTSGQWTDYLKPPMLERIEQIQKEVDTMPLVDDEEE